MYRQQQREMANMMAETQANPQFISRCANYPVVVTALQQVSGLYEKTKESNQLVKYTLETAETGVKVVASTAEPVVSKLEKPISSLDSLACSGLDQLEKTCPTITKPTEQVMEEGQEIYNKNLKPTVDKISGAYHYGVDKVTAVKDYSTSTVTAVKDYGVTKASAVKTYTQEQVDAAVQFGKTKINDTTSTVTQKVNTVLASPTGMKVLGGVNTVIDKAEGYVDMYLPEEKKDEEKEEDEEEEEQMEVDCVETEPGTQTLHRVTSLTDKMRRRMFTRAMKDMRNLQTRSSETIQKLNFTVNLMDYARDNIDNAKTKVGDGYTATKDRLNFYWAELNRTGEELEMEDFNKGEDSEEKEGEEESKPTVTPTHLELKALATARHLSLQLKHTVSVTADRVNQLLPESVHQRIKAAKTYAEDLATQFSKAENLKDLPQTVLQQTKERLTYIQDTLSAVVTSYNPLMWSRSKPSPEEGSPPGDEEEDKKDI